MKLRHFLWRFFSCEIGTGIGNVSNKYSSLGSIDILRTLTLPRRESGMGVQRFRNLEISANIGGKLA